MISRRSAAADHVRARDALRFPRRHRSGCRPWGQDWRTSRAFSSSPFQTCSLRTGLEAGHRQLAAASIPRSRCRRRRGRHRRPAAADDGHIVQKRRNAGRSANDGRDMVPRGGLGAFHITPVDQRCGDVAAQPVREPTEGGGVTAVGCCALPRRHFQIVGRPLAEPELLRGVVWWRSARH